MNNEFETVDEAYNEVLNLRRNLDVLKREYIEIICMVRTGATKEQLDYRLVNALAASGTALLPLHE